MINKLIKKYEKELDETIGDANESNQQYLDGVRYVIKAIIHDLGELKTNNEFWEKCWFDKCELLKQKRECSEEKIDKAIKEIDRQLKGCISQEYTDIAKIKDILK